MELFDYQWCIGLLGGLSLTYVSYLYLTIGIFVVLRRIGNRDRVLCQLRDNSGSMAR